jgi:phosphatidate phosphatase APP1
LNLFADPKKYKLEIIESMLNAFPDRRFVLIGDSGELDPEIYAVVARKYPRQIVRIWIRDVTGEPASAERYKRAFPDLPGDVWQVFQSPAELPPIDRSAWGVAG